MIPLEFPLGEPTRFECGDQLRNRVNEIAVNTLKLCMHEHYEDCPWREQSLYAYDSRNQALYGYYLWNNRKFTEVGFELLGRGMRTDGYLNLTAPSTYELTIPVFSFAWVSEICELAKLSGSTKLFLRCRNTIDTILDSALKRRTDGLCRPARGTTIWNFYEWIPGLSDSKCELQALYNFYLIEALNLTAGMERHCGLPDSGYERKQRLQSGRQSLSRLEQHFRLL